MDLLDELQTRVVCGDGAMGTLLIEQGVPMERCFEEMCISDPNRIRTIHEEYIAAGARVIETNTFGANAVRLERCGLDGRIAEINQSAAKLARQAAKGHDVIVAGSVGPLGISAVEAKAHGIDRRQCFQEQIEALLDGGAQMIFLETFLDFDELELALEAKNSVANVLTICSFACAAEGRLASGLPLAEAFARLRSLGAKIMGVNCIDGPQGMVKLLERVPAEYLLAAYPNAGYPKYDEGRFIYHATPDHFAQAAREMVMRGARLIGGCCGTSPTHIKAVAEAIADLAPVKSVGVPMAGALQTTNRPDKLVELAGAF